MNEDITFCTDTSCEHRECERHISQIEQHWRPHSFADFDSCEHWQEREEERNETEA